jgi:hypothetical protein
VANPTTNYGFVLPTPTDLVTDLPADFDVALQGVDTRLKALQPGTTLGDIAYSSATADTNTRLPIGTSGQVLQVNSGATAPEWAAPAGGGGMTLISTTTLSGASVTLSSIPQTYNSLFMVFNRLTNSTADGKFYLNPNAAGATARASGVEDGTAFSYGYGALFQTQNNWDRTNADNGMSLRIDNYTAALNYNKAFVWSGYYFNANPYAFHYWWYFEPIIRCGNLYCFIKYWRQLGWRNSSTLRSEIMSNPIIRIHNVTTDEVIDREMTDVEFVAWKAEQAQIKIADDLQAEKEAAKESAKAKLAALGLTTDDLEALGL